MPKILILGGPQFIGRNLLELLALQPDADITLFNRGKTNADLFPQFKRITGNRNTDDIQQIANEKWDYIIDIACYYPASLQAALHSISSQIKNYIFVSTVSVYESHPDSNYTEDAPLLACTATQAADPDIMSTYGEKKAECERILINSGIPYTILRPGLIYGPYDITDRFYYWMYQVYSRQQILIPEQGNHNVSFTYVKDLAKAILYITKSDKTFEPIYNSITHCFSIMDVVHQSELALKKNTLHHHVPLAFLQEQHIQYWNDLPMWLDSDARWSDIKFKKDFAHLLTETKQSFEESIAYYASQNWPSIKQSGLKETEYTALLNRFIDTSKAL